MNETPGNSGLEAAGLAAFEHRASELLRDSAEGLDGRVRSRLNQARQAALASLPQKSHQNLRVNNLWRRWVPAGAVAAATLLALTVVNQPGVTPPGAVPAQGLVAANGLDDLEILADNDAVEMSDMPDYDFYEWADSEAEGT